MTSRLRLVNSRRTTLAVVYLIIITFHMVDHIRAFMQLLPTGQRDNIKSIRGICTLMSHQMQISHSNYFK